MGILEPEKGSKSGNFQTNLVEFRVGKAPFLFVTLCYIGRSPVNLLTLLIGLVKLSPVTQRLVRACFIDINPEDIVDYHTHIIGHGEDTAGSTGCYLHPSIKTWKNPTMHLKGLIFQSACQVCDKESGDLQFISR